MQITTITFPELRFHPSAGNKIRGYFANWWGEKSDLLHNHSTEGKNIYRYPLVQYKVLRNAPAIIGMGKGAKLLLEMFLNLEELIIDDKIHPLTNKNLRSNEVDIGVSSDWHSYRFLSPWMALNSKNFAEYKSAGTVEQDRMLKKILIRNALSFFKENDVWLKEQLEVELDVRPITTNFKGQRMTAFKGTFKMNDALPDFIG
jgi:hypothetical protein